MPYFENLIVQDKIKSFFKNVLLNDHLAHAYLFYGNKGTGKVAFALKLAQSLNCIGPENKPCGECPSCTKISNAGHPDVKLVFPISKTVKEDKRGGLVKQKTQHPFKNLNIPGHLNIPIETIRELKKEAMYAPFEAKKRVFIIAGIEYFSREAANSFLKLLEEPPANLMIILIADDINSVLDTIRSRCQPVLFPMFSEEQVMEIIAKYYDPNDELKAIIRINQNDIGKVLENIEHKEEDIRPIILDYMRAIASNKWLEINKINDLIVQARDKNKALAFINILLLWISDAFRLNTTLLTENLVNIDMQEVIVKFATHYKSVDYPSLINNLEQAYLDIKSNLNVSLTLTNLAVEMQKLLVK
jgi:DNA polymerase III subunit delta'